MKRKSLLSLVLLSALACRAQTTKSEEVPGPATGGTAANSQLTGDGAWASVPAAPAFPGLVTGLLEGAAPAKGAASPLSLTASDGTGLRLVAMAVRAALEDPLALTELRLTFENVQDRVLEGQFKIMLPASSTVSRFAMKVGDVWQEAEVVEKQAARRAYEDFLHRKQDPALLEQAPGNEFAARVFPIPARGRKEIIVTYSQALGTHADYTVFLKGLAKVDKLSLSIHAAGVELPIFQADRYGFIPGDDFSIPTARFERRSGLRSGKIMMARVVPLPFGNTPPDVLSSSVFLVDTSASRALGLDAQGKLLSEMIASLPAGSHVSVLAFDQTTELVFDGDKADFGAGALAKLLARGALGASDIGLALKKAAEHAKARADRPRRLVLLSDGVATVGAEDGAALRAALEGVTNSPLRRIDAVVVGGLRDEGMLKSIVRGNLPEDGVVIDGKLGFAAIKKRLDSATRSKIDVKVDGASWSYPDRIDGVQPGDEVRIFAELIEGRVPRITLGGTAPFTPPLRQVDGPLLEREWASAKIASLSESPPGGDKEAGKRAIVALSTKYRVLSPFTSMLVLETDADYKRFDINRTAKLDVLGVQDGTIAVLHQDRGTSGEKLGGLDDKNQKPRDERTDLEGRAAPRDLASDVPPAEAPLLKEATRADNQPRPPMPSAAARPEPSEYRPAAPTVPARPSIDRANPFEGPPIPQATSTPSMTPPVVVREPELRSEAPYTGRFKSVMDGVSSGTKARALDDAKAWQKSAPSDVLALVAYGEASEALGDKDAAARAYGSILELFSFRADSRRFAGERLERLGTPLGRTLAHAAYEGAVAQRPDHPASHRLLAYALLREGRYAEAFAAIEKGVKYTYPAGRFLGVERILREDMALIAAAWAKAEPGKRAEIDKRLSDLGIAWENEPSVRFVLVWETDANDVDFHIRDARGGHAYYAQKDLPSGGSLYDDVTTGYGPECFTIRGAAAMRAYPYKLSAHYYARGPMGYGMGKLEIVEHDGKGGLVFDERPFVIMQDHAMVDLGVVKGPLSPPKT